MFWNENDTGFGHPSGSKISMKLSLARQSFPAPFVAVIGRDVGSEIPGQQDMAGTNMLR